MSQVIAKDGKPAEYRLLGYRVMLVAKEGWTPGEWRCSCGPVPGNNHEQEFQDIIDHGEPMSHEVAKFFFPRWNRKYKHYII